MAEALKNYTRYPHNACVGCGSKNLVIDGHLMLGTKHTGGICRMQFYSLCHECRDVDHQEIALAIMNRKAIHINSFDLPRAGAEQQTKDRMSKLAPPPNYMSI